MNGLLTGKYIKQLSQAAEFPENLIPQLQRTGISALGEGAPVAIIPFSESNVGPVSYDLTVGAEVYYLRRAAKISLDAGGEGLKIDPGETVLVLTREFLAFGPKHAAVTLSRARIMNEGIMLSSARVDPTWYGCLQIPITNNSRRTFTLRFGDRFCTLLLFQLDDAIDEASYLTRESTPHLGQTVLQYQPLHAEAWEPKRPDTVRDEDFSDVVDRFGPPYDVVRGMFELNLKKLIDYMEEQWGPNALRSLKHSAWEEEFKQIKDYREREVALMNAQLQILKEQGKDAQDDRRNMTRLVWILGIGVAGWIGLAIKIGIALEQ